MTSQNLLWSDNQAACLYLRTLINRVDLSVTVSKWFRQLHVPSFIHFRSLGLCLGHSFSWRVKVVKCQGGQVSKTGFRDIGSTGSPKKGLHNVLGHEPLVFSLTVNLSENGLLATCCFGYLTTDCPQILMTLALTVTWVTFTYLVLLLAAFICQFYLSFMSILCPKMLVKLKSCPHDLSTYKYLNINTCPFEI